MSLYVDIEKKIGDFSLNVNFRLEDEVMGILGASGAGKSMTLKCIAGIETPDRGRILLGDRVLFDSEQKVNLPPQKRRVGFLFQDFALFPNMTVEENIMCSIRNGSENGRSRKPVVDDVLGRMKLLDVRGHKVTNLSGGQKQRTALARILVNDANLLMLDEPFSALDEHLRFQLQGDLASVMQEFGKTVLLVTHDRDEAYRLCDKLAIMDAGRLDAMGTVKEVFADPVTVAGARLTGVKNVAAAIRSEDGGVKIPAWNMVLDSGSDNRVIDAAGIRMHDIRIAGKESPEDRDYLFKEGTIAEIRETPFTYVVGFRGNGFTETLFAEVGKENFIHQPGDEIRIKVEKKAIMLLSGT